MNNVLVLATLIAFAGGTLVTWIWIEFTKSYDCPPKNTINNLRYIEIDFRKIQVDWDPPEHSDRSTIDYLITLSSAYTSTDTFETSSTSLLLEDLEPCIIYNLLVEVKSKKKNRSSSSIEITVSDLTEPQEPENVKFEWETRNVEWSVKYEHCIQSYHLKFYHSDVIIKDVIVNGNVKKYKISDISTCSWYNISIQTISSKLTRSAPATLKISPKFPVSQKNNFTKNLHYNITNSETVTLYWDPNQVPDQCIAEFFISVPDVGLYFSVSGNATEASIDHLRPCMQYLVSIIPFTIHKDILGRISDISVRTTTLENKVENLTFTEVDSVLYVEWSAPVATSSCVEFYTLDFCALDLDIECRSFKPSTQVGQFGMSVTIPDIVACTVYKVSLSIMKSNKLYEFYSEIYESKVRALKAPVLRKILDVQPTSASFEWKLQDSKRNRCPVYSVILECTTDGNSFMSYEFETTRNTKLFHTDVKNLIPYSNYDCYLTFNQQVCRSEKSSAVTFATPEDVPSSVQNIMVVNLKPDGFFLMWQPPKSLNGVLNTYQIRVKHNRTLYPIPSWCPRETRKPMKFNVSPEDNFYNVTGLESYEEYVVSISAATSVGFGKSEEMIVKTSPSIPSAVIQAQYSIMSPLAYIITWKQPCYCNGILKLFKVVVRGTRENHPDDTFSYSVLPNSSFPDTEYSLRLPKLRPVYNYKIQISAKVEGVDDLGEITALSLLTPPSLPPLPHYEQLLSDMQPTTIRGHNGTQFKVTLKKDTFKDTGGELLYYAFIVGQDISMNHNMESGFLNVSKEWPTMSNYEEASSYDFIFPYQVTPPYWNPFQSSSTIDSVDIVIGEDVVCEAPTAGYCNGPLKPNTKYCMKIRAFTAAGYQDSPPLRFTTGSETIGITHANYFSVVCIFLFVTFIVCGLYYVRTRHIPLLVDVTQRMNGKRRLAIVPTKTIPVKKFTEFYSKLQESPHILKIEFNELGEISMKYTLPDNVAKRYDNYKKNRFTNFLPYDETRVKINTDHGDYINASFIEGYKETKARYIACQGPLAETFADFWTMILQYDIKVIVMLCQVVEKQKLACEKYFPDVNQTLTFNGITVECTIMTPNSLFEERKLIVSKGDKVCIVSHIKFLEWPDFGTPSDPEILVDFCNAVRKRWTDTPMVVHCSAGVGRTGTFIACDILLQQLSNNKYINIFNTVLQLRKQRPGMVQSVAQYLYLYECVYCGIKRLERHKSKLSTS